MWKIYLIVGLIIVGMSTVIIKQAEKNGELGLANATLQASYEAAVKRTQAEQATAAVLAADLERLSQEFEEKDNAYQVLLEKHKKWADAPIPVDVTEWLKLLEGGGQDPRP